MKRPYWIAGLLLVCAGLILFGTMAYRSLFASGGVGAAKVEETKEVASAEVKTIRVQAVSADVQMTAYEGDRIDVELKGSAAKNGDVELWTEQEGSELKVEVRMKRKLFSFGSNSLDLIIKVPDRAFEEIAVNTVSGEQELSALQAEELNIDSVSGEVTLQNSTGKTSVTTISGEQLLERNQGASLTASSTSGAIQVSDSDYGDWSVKSISGELVLEDVNGPVQAKTTSGKVDVEFVKMAALKANTVSGKIEVKTPQKAAFELKGKTVSGSIQVQAEGFQFIDSAKSHFSGSAGENGPLLEMETVSGGIEIGV